MDGTGHMDGCAGEKKIARMDFATKMAMGTWSIHPILCIVIASILNAAKTRRRASDISALALSHS